MTDKKETKKDEKKEEKPKATSKIKLEARFKVVKEVDGEQVKSVDTYTSEGKDVEELLENLDFPQGVNALVTVEITNGSKTFTKAFGPYKARRMLEYKNAEDLKNAFRGIV